MSINKETMSLGMPWEKEYSYSQAVKVGDTIYVSGQVAHDDNGKIVGKGEWRFKCVKHIPIYVRCLHNMEQLWII
jgi:enamine deaminase RidA (YjgF/YER057c/UK114 family)